MYEKPEMDIMDIEEDIVTTSEFDYGDSGDGEEIPW